MSSILEINTLTLGSLLTISVLSIILSSWSVDTFRKLKEKSSDSDFQSKCKVDPSSVSSGLTFAGIMLAVSLMVFIYCCVVIAKKSGFMK